jgi:CheY-like chemotaxis protein
MKVLQDKNIFIVEDDSLNRLVFRLILTKVGATVAFDTSGQNALSFLQKSAPVDIILLDLMLTHGQNGFDLFQAIRALPHYANTPIVAVSAIDASQGIPPIDSDLFPHQLAHILEGQAIWEGQSSSTLSRFNTF